MFWEDLTLLHLRVECVTTAWRWRVCYASHVRGQEPSFDEMARAVPKGDTISFPGRTPECLSLGTADVRGGAALGETRRGSPLCAHHALLHLIPSFCDNFPS